MSRRFISACLTSLLLATSLDAYSASIWKLTQGERILYIGGTIHILSQSDYPLPEAYEKLYQKSDTLVFETDIASLEEPDFAAQLQASATYPVGQDISTKLSPDTQKLVGDFANQFGLSFNQLKQFKPGMLAMILSNLSFQNAGLTEAGVDAYYSDKASNDNKPQSWLETPQQQLGFINSMGIGNEEQFIRYTLRDLDQTDDIVDSLKPLWREGKVDELAQLLVLPMKADYPDTYEKLLVSRNKNWLPQIEAYLQSPETEFILVGTAHLVGPDSVIALLQQRGYKIEQIK